MIEDDINKLNNLAESFRRMKNKVILLRLLNEAMDEYEKYDFISARKLLIDAYKLDKQNPATLRGFGFIKQSDGKLDAAISYYKRALKYSDKKETEYTMIGMAYYLQDKLDLAVEYFNLAINENDEYTKAYEGRNQAMLENQLKLIDVQESLKKFKL